MNRIILTLILFLVACGGVEPTVEPVIKPSTARPPVPVVDVPMAATREALVSGACSSMQTHVVELAPGALHVWVKPQLPVYSMTSRVSPACSVGVAVDLLYWTDADTTQRPLPQGEVDLGAWATRLYVGVQVQGDASVKTGELTGTIRYEYAQL